MNQCLTAVICREHHGDETSMLSLPNHMSHVKLKQVSRKWWDSNSIAAMSNFSNFSHLIFIISLHFMTIGSENEIHHHQSLCKRPHQRKRNYWEASLKNHRGSSGGEKSISKINSAPIIKVEPLSGTIVYHLLIWHVSLVMAWFCMTQLNWKC